MWWSVKTGLSRRSTGLAANAASSPSSLNQVPSASASSSQLDRMIHDISRDLSTIMGQEEKQVKLELAKRARELCMKDISHDLRTPLNAIIGFAQMMENGALGQIENPQYLEYLRHIRESGYELLDRVEGLLEEVPSAEDAGQPTGKKFKKVGKLEEAVA